MEHIQAVFHDVIGRLDALGPWGPLAFIGVYVAATFVFVPIILMFFAAGILFGVWMGFAVVGIGSVISACLFFLAGRYLSRGWVLKKISKNPKVKKLDDAVSHEGWKMVALLRLTSILPFWVINYGLGLSKIPLSHFAIATAIGMAPGILLNVWIGSYVGEVIFQGNPLNRTPAEWLLVGVSFIAMIVLGCKATFMVKKILNSK